MKIKGKFLAQGDRLPASFNFEKIEQLTDFSGSECIVVKNLNPDFTILLDKISLIITEKGSSLSHLAIVTREYGKAVILASDAKKLPKKGKINLENEGGQTEIALE